MKDFELEVKLRQEMLGKRIRAARLRSRLTQAQLSDLTGVQKSAISKYERGVIFGISGDTITRLAKALDVPVSELFSSESEVVAERTYDRTGQAPIGERIMHRREWLRMSQSELALEVGLTDRSSISKIETGENHIPVGSVQVYAKALRTTAHELVGCTTVEWSVFCHVWQLLNP